MSISPFQLNKLAHLARIEVAAEERPRLAGELEAIAAQMEKIVSTSTPDQVLEADGAEPGLVTRPDIPTGGDGREFIRAASDVFDDWVRLPAPSKR